MCADHVWRFNIEGGRVSSYFEQPHKLGLVPEYHTQKVEGGGKITCSKNRILGIVCTHGVFGARKVFETIFGNIQNFWQKQIFENVSHML